MLFVFSHLHWLETKEQASFVPCRAHAWAHGISTHACIWSNAHSDPWHTWCNDLQKSDSTDPALSSGMGSTPVGAHRPTDRTRSSESCSEHHTPPIPHQHELPSPCVTNRCHRPCQPPCWGQDVLQGGKKEDGWKEMVAGQKNRAEKLPPLQFGKQSEKEVYIWTNTIN